MRKVMMTDRELRERLERIQEQNRALAVVMENQRKQMVQQRLDQIGGTAATTRAQMVKLGLIKEKM